LIPVILSTSPSSASEPDITTLVLEGDVIVGLGNVTEIHGVAVNNSGGWLVKVRTDTGNDVLIKNGLVFMHQGGAVLDPPGALIQSIGRIALNNAGTSAFNMTVVDTSDGGFNVLQGVWRDDLLVALQSAPPPSPPYSIDANYGIFVDADLNDLGEVLYHATWAGPADTNSGLFLSQFLLMREGVTMVDSTLIDEFSEDRQGFEISDTGDWVIFEATLDGGLDGAFLLLTAAATAIDGDPVPRPDPFLVAAPNPFTTESTISYSLSREQAIDLRVYDVKGRLVATLGRGPRSAGPQQTTWNGYNTSGRPVASGVYFVQLRTELGTVRSQIVKRR
jgi:hypothetical protein